MAEIEGSVENVVYRNDENGYSVLSLKSSNGRVTCVGILPMVVEGERLRIEGEWTEHKQYGRQMRVNKFQSVKPTTKSEIEKYLSSGIIKGIGKSTAKLIVDYFGADALDILDDDAQRLREITGIGRKRAGRIIDSYQKQRENRRIILFLQSCGMSVNMADRVIKTFGQNTFSIVNDDPYMLSDRVDGIGFKTADSIAMSLGVDRNSDHRISSAICYVLEEAVNTDGHVFLPENILKRRAGELLLTGEELIDRAILSLTLDKKLVRREGNVYLKRLYDAERDVAGMLASMLINAPDNDISNACVEIKQREEQCGIELSDEQRQAVIASSRERVTILTGGPGTGKTTCVNYILWMLKRVCSVKLCAPTGRAAKRMREATGEEAMTIHRLLEYSGEEGGFARNEDNTLECDAVIVDETSMVDIFLMRALLRALKNGSRLVLVGDIDQLPSVGAGNVLRDIVDSDAVPVNRLTHIYRQAAQSYIVKNAHRINHGEIPVFNTEGSDCFFESKQSASDTLKTVVELVTKRLPKFLGLEDGRDIQVMTPMKKGECGVWAINSSLQNALNPGFDGMAVIRMNDYELREGDKVMQIKNNYEIGWSKDDDDGYGVFNGDIGFIKSVDEEERTVEVLFDDDRLVVYESEDLPQLELAYCMSVHKSQGSEFDAVVIPLVSGPRMLYTRNLLYTALTRAKKLAVIVGRKSCVSEMVRNDYISERYSSLKEAIREIMSINVIK